MKDRPEFEVRYTNELPFRAEKDSTIWGDSSTRPAWPFNLAPNPVSPVRKFVPSYRQRE